MPIFYSRCQDFAQKQCMRVAAVVRNSMLADKGEPLVGNSRLLTAQMWPIPYNQSGNQSQLRLLSVQAPCRHQLNRLRVLFLLALAEARYLV